MGLNREANKEAEAGEEAATRSADDPTAGLVFQVLGHFLC
jgi:hypothetical protein